jgi:hypothetical protein
MGYFDEKKLMFGFLAAIMYLIIASPMVYNFVGSIIGLEEYDDSASNDRTILLFIHGIVYFLGAVFLVNVYKTI